MTTRAEPAARSARAWVARHWWPLAVAGVLLLAALLRLWIMWRADWLMDGDEATMALVGLHILHDHERPIYFPGQAYMGVWQSYLAAPLFWLFGVSRPVAKLVPLLSSLAWVATTMLLAARVWDRRTAVLAGIFAALPSLYFISTTLRLSYPLIDVMAIGQLILLVAIDTVWRDEPPPRLWLRFLALGLLAGVGFWMHSAVAMYVAPAALALLLRWPRRCLWPGAPLAIAGFLVGALPVFNHARQYEYTLFHYLRGNPSDTAARGFPEGYLKIARHLVEHLLPRYLGVSVPWQDASSFLQLLVAVPTLAALGWLIWRNRRAPLNWLRARPQRSSPELVLLLFGAVVLATYVLSRFSVYALTFPNVDATGRYVAPLGTLLPLALAGATLHWWRTGRAGRVAALALIACVLTGTAATWLRSDPQQVFQSPYYRQLPASNAELIRALDELGVDAVWIDHWAGKPLMFDSAERIAAADYVDLRVWGGIDRLGAASSRVFASDRPAFVFVTDAPTVPLEDALPARGVPVVTRSVAGYRIVLPLEPVDPATVVDALIASR